MDMPVLVDQQELEQVCLNTACSLEDLQGAIDDRDGWRESQENPCKQRDLIIMYNYLY